MNVQLPSFEIDLLNELVRGQTLPMPTLDSAHMEIILELLQKAYQEIKTEYPTRVATAPENAVNSLMVARLNHLIQDDPLAKQLVRAISRGSEVTSYDAQHIEKRPDIQISLTSRVHLFPLIVECKLLDEPQRKTTKLYCQNGLARFINGEYAWTDSEAIMLAYVRDGSFIATQLHPFLTKANTTFPHQYQVVSFPEKCPFLPDVARSKHGRPFKYLHDGQAGEFPGEILVWHLWVR
jgi:hypothetical protein